jgi:WD40 repeat protein
MRKAGPSLHRGQVFLIALVALLTRIAPVSAQDGAKIEIVPILGHSYEVRSVAFSPDSARVLSGSVDRTIKLWDAETGALIRTFMGHSSPVNSVGFSPGGARVVNPRGSGDTRVRDMPKLAPRRL